MIERMTDEALEQARQDVLGELDLTCDCAEDDTISEGTHVDGCFQGAAEAGFNAMCADHDRARRVEAEQAETIKRLAACLREYITFPSDEKPCWCDNAPCGETFRALQCDRNMRALQAAERFK